MTNAIGYIRVSTESQLDGLGLDVQRDAIRDLAAAEGFDLGEIFADEGVSGSEDVAGRAGLAAALEALEPGMVLVIPKLDRLARDLMVQESILRDVWKQQAAVMPVVEGERAYCHEDDPSDPSRTLIRQVLGAVAAYERAMIRARLVAGRRRRISDCGYAGGPEPYGWSDEVERENLAHVVAQRQRGCTWQQCADELNQADRWTRSGSKWIPSSLQRTVARAQDRGTGVTPRLIPGLAPPNLLESRT